MSDLFGRPYIYLLCLIFFTVGFILTAASPTLAAYVIGAVLIALGAAGLNLLNTVLLADLIPLQWRGFWQGLISTVCLFVFFAVLREEGELKWGG